MAAQGCVYQALHAAKVFSHSSSNKQVHSALRKGIPQPWGVYESVDAGAFWWARGQGIFEATVGTSSEWRANTSRGLMRV